MTTRHRLFQRSDLRLSRRLPIDFAAVAEESGLARGKLGFSPALGWGVFNTYGDVGPHFGAVTPPGLRGDETEVCIDGSDWCLLAPNSEVRP